MRGAAPYGAEMNEQHQRLCTSEEWAAYLHDEVLAGLTAAANPGGELLEIGPGPGAATEWLRHRVRRLVAVEVDPDAADALRERFAGTNVEIVVGDATSLDFDDESFDAVVCCTMLHHVPTMPKQFAILTHAVRVLRPGGVLFGSDSLASQGLHHFHEGDTYNPVDPSNLLLALRVLGCEDVTVTVGDVLTFVAHKTTGSDNDCGRTEEDR